MPKPLFQRLAPHNTIRGFTLAALERYRDGTALSEDGRRLGAIYLTGYAVEMLLKAAYFTRLGFGDDQPIQKADLEAAVGKKVTSQASQLKTPVTGDYHDIGCWAALLVALRAARLDPHPPPIRQGLMANVTAVQSLWRVTLRYHRNRASPSETERVQQACGWVVRNRKEL